jgi:restriction system protein
MTIRILDQAKAYKPGHLVTHDDVRAMLGTLATDSNASKGVITTTSDFQPGILSGDEFERFLPYRLELKNGQQLTQWLSSIKNSTLPK